MEKVLNGVQQQKKNNMFDRHNKEGPLYYIEGRNNKGDIKKYQYHPHSDQFMDEEDEEIDTKNFVRRNPEITKHKELQHLRVHLPDANSEDISSALESSSEKAKSAVLMHAKAKPEHWNHPSVGENILSDAAENTNKSTIHDKILNHPKVGEGSVSVIAGKSTDPKIQEKILNHSKTNEYALRGIAVKTTDPKIHEKLINHPKSSDWLLGYVASNTTDPNIREKILNHPKMGIESLSAIARKTNDPKIHERLISHPEVSFRSVTDMAENSVDPKIHERILNHPKSGRSTYEALIKNNSVDPNIKNLAQEKINSILKNY